MPQDLNRFFQVEAEDLVAKIGSALERSGGGPVDAETLRELRRWTHTLKGAAQVVRRENIAQTAHQLETVLDGVADPARSLSAQREALETVNALRGMLEPPNPSPAGLETPDSDRGPVAEPWREVETLRIELREIDRLLQEVNESAILTAGIRRSTHPLARAAELAAMIRRESASGGSRNAQHVQTLTDEIEDVLAGMRREMEGAIGMVYQELDDLRSRVERLRLVRAEMIVEVLERAGKSAAAESGKAIRLESVGGDLEFDAHLLIAIRDALIQIVRNAVAHGIEMPDERTARGKPGSGTIRVIFGRQGARNQIAIHDDGRGIDFEGLRRTAVKRGWLNATQAREASAEQLTELLLRPGVTTSASAGMLSGRGVGLDVVNRAVTRLKGDLRIKAVPGQGTTFEITLPASLNAMPALIVSAGGRKYGIQRDAIVRTVSLKKLERLGGKYVLDGYAMPLVHLATLMGLESAPADLAAQVGSDSQPFLLGVDAMLGIRQVVLHTLLDFLELEPFVIGAAVDADGHVLPIINPLLMESHLEPSLGARSEAASETIKALPILVIDDSLTTRMLEQSIFEMEGYQVELASSAEEGFAMALQRNFGLFLVDVEMPGMDGVAFVEQLRREPGLRDIPAILVTSKNSVEDRARGLNAGARDYVVKSEFDQRYLIRRVRELIRVVQ